MGLHLGEGEQEYFRGNAVRHSCQTSPQCLFASYTRTSGDGGNQMLLSSVANYCIVGNFHAVQIFTFFMGRLVNMKFKKKFNE